MSKREPLSYTESSYERAKMIAAAQARDALAKKVVEVLGLKGYEDTVATREVSVPRYTYGSPMSAFPSDFYTTTEKYVSSYGHVRFLEDVEKGVLAKSGSEALKRLKDALK